MVFGVKPAFLHISAIGSRCLINLYRNAVIFILHVPLRAMSDISTDRNRIPEYWVMNFLLVRTEDYLVSHIIY